MLEMMRFISALQIISDVPCGMSCSLDHGSTVQSGFYSVQSMAELSTVLSKRAVSSKLLFFMHIVSSKSSEVTLRAAKWVFGL